MGNFLNSKIPILYTKIILIIIRKLNEKESKLPKKCIADIICIFVRLIKHSFLWSAEKIFHAVWEKEQDGREWKRGKYETGRSPLIDVNKIEHITQEGFQS